MSFASALAALDCFETVAVTAEDRGRAAAYRTAKARDRERVAVGSFDEWLRSLNLTVHVNELTEANAVRVTQLLNKTNQMNLSTRRLTATELHTWASAPGHKIWGFRLVDKFEDAGVTGILSLVLDGPDARIVDFVLSCRAMGRQLEEAMLYQAVHYARCRGSKTLWAEYIPTPKNGPCRRFLERCGFVNGNGHTFRWNLDTPYAAPRHVEIRGLAG
jgi:FkbH-like protein